MAFRLLIILCINGIFSGLCFGQDVTYRDYGKASFYAAWLHGYRTANGERLNNNNFTAAHRSLPFNSILKVKNPRNDSVVFVRVNDRGPYRYGRIIDITQVAAYRLDMVRNGIIDVQIENIPVYPDSVSFFGKNKKTAVKADSISTVDTMSLKNDSIYFIQSAIQLNDPLQMDILIHFMNNYKKIPLTLVSANVNYKPGCMIYAGYFKSRKQAESIAIFSGLDYKINFFLR